MRTRWSLGLALAIALGWAACDDEDQPGTDALDAGDRPNDDSRRRLLRSIAQRVVMPSLEELDSEAEALREAVEDFADASEDGEAATEREQAQAAFTSAMQRMQRVELLAFGPASAPDMEMSGQGLRDEVYSWPTASSCRVDQEIAAGLFEDDGFIEETGVNAYGLDALEYLLWVDSPDNTCSPQSAFNTSGEWAALSEQELRRRRGRYALIVAEGVEEATGELLAAFHPDQGNFVAELTDPSAGEVYDSAQEALDAVFAAMFYLDLQVKDRKLAIPAGISADCAQATCPMDVESPWAGLSKQHIADNLRAFQQLYHGGAPDDDAAYGFDAMLVELGADELAQNLTDDTEAAIEAIEAIDGELAQALADDLDSVEDAHAAVKRVTDDLKSQFVTVLGLRIPQEGAGDND